MDKADNKVLISSQDEEGYDEPKSSSLHARNDNLQSDDNREEKAEMRSTPSTIRSKPTQSPDSSSSNKSNPTNQSVRSQQVDNQLLALSSRKPRKETVENDSKAHKKERSIMEPLARKPKSEVEALVKESVRDVASEADVTRIEEEVEARVMRKLLHERQQYVLRDECNNQQYAAAEEESKTEIEDEADQQQPLPSSPRTRRLRPARHLVLPCSVPQQAKTATASIISSSTTPLPFLPGAVRIAGMNGAVTDSSELASGSMALANDEENPMDQSSMTRTTCSMQLPQPTVPAYFQDEIMLEATLVDSIRRMGTSVNSAPDSRLIVEAKPIDEETTDLQCRDVVRSKKLCRRIVLCVILIVCVLLAILLPIVKQKEELFEAMQREQNDNAPQESPEPQEPFQSDLPPVVLRNLEDPNSPQSWANSWIMGDPNFANYSTEKQRQRFALAALYRSTNGDDWIRNDNWLDYDADECTEWHMAHGNNSSCDDEGRLAVLNLTSNNLRGTLGQTMYLLASLKVVDMSDNKLAGNLPPLSLAARQLEVVDLSNNQLSGILASELGFSNSKLRILRNSNNRLSGDFLSSLTIMAPNIVEFDGTGNLYGGTIPELMGTLSNLEVLRFGYNDRVHGTIPSSIGSLERLRILDFPGTQISGTVPSNFESLQLLQSAEWSNTNLTGELPEAICNLQAMGQLELSVNCDMVQCCG
ncbi:Leucine Rich Repeat [Seminavis robusta]|uniref:Leucine Rich Repeat n=1 Tax=Seminavis robusta TaxID=568900 RepID=A0A9N8HD96_9STRA|nr:Leucine Rich Repeat [Seminavis robusta]|eukprot:Sro351_g123970.1 Leucine Rich Repeat (702) ;mRNA; r:41112-43298